MLLRFQDMGSFPFIERIEKMEISSGFKSWEAFLLFERIGKMEISSGFKTWEAFLFNEESGASRASTADSLKFVEELFHQTQQ